MFFGLWAWWILCAPDTLAWNVAFMIGNYVHAIYMFIKIKRPRKFSKDCEAVYARLFEQYGVKRFQFEQLAKKCSVLELNQGDFYGKEGTPAERISILLEGRSVYGGLLSSINIHRSLVVYIPCPKVSAAFGC